MARTIAVTGHMDLTSDTEALVEPVLRELLEGLAEQGSGVVGISCLAPGADSLFAEVLLALGGELDVVLPFRGYREALGAEANRLRFDRLLAAAAEVEHLPYAGPSQTAFESANSTIVRRAELLVAVWDGVLSGQRGGTEAAVAEARTTGIPVHVIWPSGASRG